MFKLPFVVAFAMSLFTPSLAQYEVVSTQKIAP